jgi:hypothetical protein
MVGFCENYNEIRVPQKQTNCSLCLQSVALIFDKQHCRYSCTVIIYSYKATCFTGQAVVFKLIHVTENTIYMLV